MANKVSAGCFDIFATYILVFMPVAARLAVGPFLSLFSDVFELDGAEAFLMTGPGPGIFISLILVDVLRFDGANVLWLDGANVLMLNNKADMPPPLDGAGERADISWPDAIDAPRLEEALILVPVQFPLSGAVLFIFIESNWGGLK